MSSKKVRLVPPLSLSSEEFGQQFLGNIFDWLKPFLADFEIFFLSVQLLLPFKKSRFLMETRWGRFDKAFLPLETPDLPVVSDS